MKSNTLRIHNRRKFLQYSAAIAGTSYVFGQHSALAQAEPPPETDTIRLIFEPEIKVLCYAPQYVAEELLRSEGFKNIEYVTRVDASEARTLDNGKADIGATFTGYVIDAIDKNNNISILSGLHPGCVEVFAGKHIKNVRDLKNKRIAVLDIGSPDYIFMAALVAYIGLDPRKDIDWVSSNPTDWENLLVTGEVEAIISYPPFSYGLHARDVGHVILNTNSEKPWRHYFCCVLAANKSFVEQHPVAAKRAMRAILKACDVCVEDPDRSAKFLVERGFADNFEHVREMFRDLPYGAWRDYNPEDTVRFFSLRLHEAGVINNDPEQIIAKGTDWRILQELRAELKG